MKTSAENTTERPPERPPNDPPNDPWFMSCQAQDPGPSLTTTWSAELPAPPDPFFIPNHQIKKTNVPPIQAASKQQASSKQASQPASQPASKQAASSSKKQQAAASSSKQQQAAASSASSWQAAAGKQQASSRQAAGKQQQASSSRQAAASKQQPAFAHLKEWTNISFKNQRDTKNWTFSRRTALKQWNRSITKSCDDAKLELFPGARPPDTTLRNWTT